MNNTRFAITTIFLFVSLSNACAQTVEMAFELSNGQAMSDPVVFPNEDLEITVTPELEIKFGQFKATFASDIDGVIV